MDQGDAQRSLWKIEPPPSAISESSTARQPSSWISRPKLVDSHQSTMSPYLSRPSDDSKIQSPERDVKGTKGYEKGTETLPYDYTIHISQEIPERMPVTTPLSSLLAKSSHTMDDRDNVPSQSKPWVSSEVASTLVSESPHLGPEPRMQNQYHEKGLLQANPANSNVVSSVKLAEIHQLRIDIWSSRSQIHQLRASLRQKQQIKSSADDILFGRVRLKSLGVLSGESGLPLKSSKTLEHLLQDSQDARDAYGPLEDEVNQLEDYLSSQEFKLSQLEEAFYSQPKATQTQISSSDTGKIEFDLNNHNESITTNRHEGIFEDLADIKYHPLVSQYLSKLGDIDLLHERLEDLIEEKESLEAERQSRLRFGLTLDPDDQEWLDGSQHEYDTLVSQSKSLKREAEEMKRECLARGLIDEDGEPTTFRDQEESSFKGDEVHPGSQTSEYVKYPFLLPHPGVDQGDIGHYDPRPDEKSDITTIRINKWMLDRLRMSALDVNLLASTFEGSIGKMDNEWQYSVLSFWYNDGTVNSMPGFHVYTGSLTTEGGPASDSEPIGLKISPFYHEFSKSRLSSKSASSADTEIAILRGVPRVTPRETPLFWNSD